MVSGYLHHLVINATVIKIMGVTMKCKSALFYLHRFLFLLVLSSVFFLYSDCSSPVFADERILSLKDAYASAIKNHEAIKIAEE